MKNSEIYIYSSGKKRRKTDCKRCQTCNKQFMGFSWQEQKYCSKKCWYHSKKEKVTCTTCQKEIFVCKSRIKRSKNFFCCRGCYNLRSKNVKKIKRGTLYFDSLLNNSSCACGINKKYLLSIHHIDGNKNNNDPKNHEIVCENCHRKRHLKKRNKDGEWVYHPRSLTPRELLPLL